MPSIALKSAALELAEQVGNSLEEPVTRVSPVIARVETMGLLVTFIQEDSSTVSVRLESAADEDGERETLWYLEGRQHSVINLALVMPMVQTARRRREDERYLEG